MSNPESETPIVLTVAQRISKIPWNIPETHLKNPCIMWKIRLLG